MTTSKIALGTAQFGLNYGVANTTGRPSSQEISSLLHLAQKHGITCIDTAIAYGNSEEELGKNDLSQFSVISKVFDALGGNEKKIKLHIKNQVTESLLRLGIKKLDSLLLHRPEQLLSKHGEEIRKALLELKDDGLVNRIGFSVYAPEQLQPLTKVLKPDLVQLPMSIIDNRFHESGAIAFLSNEGISIHIRSIFLQGLLLCSPKKRPKKFEKWNSFWSEWDSWIDSTSMSPLEACLKHALCTEGIEKVVIGTESKVQLEEIIRCSPDKTVQLPNPPSISDAQLLNPSNWVSL